MKLGSKLAMIVFVLVAVAHALRLLFEIPLVAGGMEVPAWVSVIGMIVPAWIATLLWRERSIEPKV